MDHKVRHALHACDCLPQTRVASKRSVKELTALICTHLGGSVRKRMMNVYFVEIPGTPPNGLCGMFRCMCLLDRGWVLSISRYMV